MRSVVNLTGKLFYLEEFPRPYYNIHNKLTCLAQTFFKPFNIKRKHVFEQKHIFYFKSFLSVFYVPHGLVIKCFWLVDK